MVISSTQVLLGKRRLYILERWMDYIRTNAVILDIYPPVQDICLHPHHEAPAKLDENALYPTVQSTTKHEPNYG